MHVYEEPCVYLVGMQGMDKAELKRFLSEHALTSEGETWETDAPDVGSALAEIGGRVCYLSFTNPRPGGNRVYLEHIKEVGHGSVLEHAVFTIIVAGVSRSLSHELVRHRAGMSYSQLSQRYVSESRGEFVVPREVMGDQDTYNVWLQSVTASWDAYKRLVIKLESKLRHRDKYRCRACNGTGFAKGDGTAPNENCNECKGTGIIPALRTDLRKAARGAARSVLPNATETKIQVTGNARAWRHFLEMRAAEAADAEIRTLAVHVWRALRGAAPNLFGDYDAHSLEDGTAYLETPYRKV